MWSYGIVFIQEFGNSTTKMLWPHCVRADAARALALHPQLT